jgi:hypothetical protein
MLPRVTNKLDPAWQGQTVHLHATDAPAEWLLTLGPGASCEVQRGHAKGDLAVRGPIDALWLWATGRVSTATPTAGIEMFGDTSLADRWHNTIRF